MVELFLDCLIGEAYKILTSYEADSGGDKYFSYLDSLSSEVMGSLRTFPDLGSSKHYIKAVNLINFLRGEPVSHFRCRRLTFEIISEIELAKAEIGG